MASNVVSFVGQDENGILWELALGMMQPLPALGLTGHLISFRDPNWQQRFEAVAQDGIVMGFGSAGIGSDLRVDGQIVWDKLKVPFISLLADPPSWAPHLHRPESRYVGLGYLYDEWLDIQRRFFRAPQVCGRQQLCVAPNPHRDRVPWSQRAHRMVFIKSGESPEARRAAWVHLPRKLRAVLEDAAAEACRHGTMGLLDLLLDCLHAHGLYLEGHENLLLPVMHELDLFVRAERSTRMVKALSRVPAEIVGRGWDHVAGEGTRAQFYPSIPAVHLPELVANTRFVVNTTPNLGSGPHERVLAGFAARACVISDQTAYARMAFASVPTYFGVEWHTDDLADRIAAIWDDNTDYGPRTDVALRLTETDFAPVDFMKGLLELAGVVDLLRRCERPQPGR